MYEVERAMFTVECDGCNTDVKEGDNCLVGIQDKSCLLLCMQCASQIVAAMAQPEEKAA